jgi:hypothetical protein
MTKGRRTDNTMTKGKRQTTQWPKEKDRQHNDQRKKTDNTMTKGKSTKRQTTNHKTLHRKLMIEHHQPTL